MPLLDDLRFPPPPRLMGILNVTPDSFSDGGRYFTADTAIAQARTLAAEGADVLDIGGESTRPGAQPVPADEQIRRVVPVIAAIHGEFPALPISIDTRDSTVATAAIQAGATWINDISGGLADPQMLPLAAYTGSTIVLMHIQGTPGTMQQKPHYDDVVAEVTAYLIERLKAARDANVLDPKIWLDPGIGFGKTLEHNRKLLAACDGWAAQGWNLLVGHSRKSFVEQAWREALELPRTAALPTEARLPGTLAVSLRCWLAGVRMLRVHDVAAHKQAFALFQNDISRYI